MRKETRNLFDDIEFRRVNSKLIETVKRSERPSNRYKCHLIMRRRNGDLM
jgi:hypothetical protein